ncbi:hypothetical protein VCUG_02114 [Vavraia culicis subsp. floridensis]|uniref:Uncharacterized protein n=1 Tax=Vavraia culicis (isolate floridensis) TaxID=948595 RepID=L2GSS4_VAVCU|nr:uncharacterized protein VCUG_02114 [Vavraia culicis subsp. floridensis]ELA46392.1 hypothetical protein VCUG_02114 [Vavraia culicis subsp. floridensis]
MDLEHLQAKIKKQPEIYEREYISMVKTYQSLLNVPPMPDHITVLQFIVSVCHLYNVEIGKFIISHFRIERDDERRKDILYLMGDVRKKGLMCREDFVIAVFECEFKLDLLRIAHDTFFDEHTGKLRITCSVESESSGKDNDTVSKNFVSDIVEMFKQYYYKGTISQKKMALFFLIYVYDHTEAELNDVIMDALKDENVQGLSINYVLGLLPLTKGEQGVKMKVRKKKNRGKKGFDYERFKEEQQVTKERILREKEMKRDRRKNITDVVANSMSVEEIISCSKASDTSADAMYNHFVIDTTTVKVIKEIHDPKAVINLLLVQVKGRKDIRSTRLKKLKVISLIKLHFKVPVRINDILLKMIDPSKDDLPVVMHILVRSIERSDTRNIVQKINHLFCTRKDDDMKCYGLNLLKEIVLLDRNEEIISDIRNIASEFRNNKVKGVFHTYCALMRAIKYGVTDNKSFEYLAKRKKWTQNNKL